MASPIAVPPGSRKTAGLIPIFSRRAASRFTCVDFPQPSEPSNVISGMATILRQRGAIVERPIFALFGLRQRGKFDPMTEAVASGFPADIGGGNPEAFICGFSSRCCAMHTGGIGQNYRGTESAPVFGTTSLLVVPNYHRQGSATEDQNFVSWLRDLEARGYEIVIHGYFHERPRREGERIKEKFITQFYTQDEGEFFDLDYDEAFARITRARDEFEAARLSPIGFVAPAWLLNREGERAARDAGMQYTTRIDSVLDLLTNQRESTRSLVYSTAFDMASHREPGVECRARAQSRNARAGTVEHSSFRFRGPKIWDQILQFIAALRPHPQRDDLSRLDW